jgi:hypothetical protein
MIAPQVRAPDVDVAPCMCRALFLPADAAEESGAGILMPLLQSSRFVRLVAPGCPHTDVYFYGPTQVETGYTRKFRHDKTR